MSSTLQLPSNFILNKTITDPWKKLVYKREQNINKLINNTIKQDTQKIVLEKKLTDEFQEILKSQSPNSISGNNSTCPKNSKFLDKMPYILVGLVESTFIDESKMQKVKEYGIGLVLESNIVLVPAKNLIFDNKNYPTDTESEEKPNFKIFEVEFSLLNFSPKYSKYLPNKLKVRDFFCPLDIESDSISEEDKILNGWGLILLEFPIGEFLRFILEENKLIENRNIKMRNNHEYNYNNEKEDFVKLNFLENKDIESTEIMFLEGIAESQNSKSEEIFQFIESIYEMKFDENLIFLDEIKKTNEKEIIPGIVIGKLNRKYYLIGINTNIIISTSELKVMCEDQSQNQEKQNDENENSASKQEHTNRMALRFNKNICNLIKSKILDIKSTPGLCNDLNSDCFSIRLFKLLDNSMQDKLTFLSFFKDNCKLLNQKLNELRKIKDLSNEEKSMLNIYTPTGDCNYFLKFSFTLIWTKISSQTFENNLMEIESHNFGIEPASHILSCILKSLDKLKSLNLKGNNILSQGLKNLIKPIYNTKQILYVGGDLRLINLEANKLSSKSMKYLRHLLKVCPQLNTLNLNHNYITSDGVKHLVSAMKDKEHLSSLHLGYNMLGSSSGRYLREILKDCKNLSILDLQSNNLTDESLIQILSVCNSVEDIYLGNNNLTRNSADKICEFIVTNNNLKLLWVNNNSLNAEGIKILSQSFVNNECCNLFEINLNSVDCGPEGASYLFENLKSNKSLRKLYLSHNNIGDYGCKKINSFMRHQIEYTQTEEYLRSPFEYGITNLVISNNNISDSGAKFIVDSLINIQSLREIKLNSNQITDEGGEILLYAVLFNTAITKFNIENNMTTWRQNNLHIKSIRENIKIFY